MKAKIFNQKLINSLKNRKDILIQKFPLQYKKGKFELVRIASKKISKKNKIIMIATGIHGNEKAGPLTILKYGNKIINHAHKTRLKLIIYPLINPSGFEKNTRYNIDSNAWGSGSGDFIRYELKNGKMTDDLARKKVFKNWYWSSDIKNIKLPEETRLMHELLKKEPLKQIAAVIDIHQDCLSSQKKYFAYQYSFENKKVFEKIVLKISKIIPVLKNKKMWAGYASGIALKSDKNGFIIRHDGTITDLLYRLGTKCSIAIETIGSTPLDKAMLVNLTWILNIIDLIKTK
jgi:hypothetical protein